MATKVKRCLYIGLGGTGMNSILHAKKKFVDTYGEVPPMIGFLGIDTDSNGYKNTLTTDLGEEIGLMPNEKYPIYVQNARPIYDVNKDNFSWIPERNLYALTSMMLGAGQVRTNGRFALTVHYNAVKNKIKALLDKITSANIINNDKYELLNTNTEIHLVFSICGGTGCGTFINMAYLIRELAPTCKLTAYAVLPDVFKAMSHSGMSKVAPNAYGAIMDLDYLMGMGLGSTPITLDYLGTQQIVRERPFNSVIFVDNKNPNLDSFTHIDELTELISLALVTAAGELSSAAASVSDNLEKNISAGSMDIKDKKAWAAGMGGCEIIFKGSTLGKIYSIKAAKSLIDRLFNSCEDIDTIVNSWIDSDNVNIRENNNNDHVIDFICDKNPKYNFSLSDYANPQPDIEQYQNMCKEKSEDISQRITTLTNRVRNEFKKLIVSHINKECGVSSAQKIVEGVQTQIDLFLGEMCSEKEELVTKQPRLQMALDNAIADLKEYDGRFWKSRDKLEDFADGVVAATKAVVVCEREILRRNSAITVFNNIKTMLIETWDKIKNLKDKLKSAYQILTEDLAKIQNSVGKATRTFQIDLACDAIGKIGVDLEDFQVQDFILTLKGESKLLSLIDDNSQEIKQKLLMFTSKTARAKKLSQTTIDEVLNLMPEEDFKRCVEVAIQKSMPLFRYSYEGYAPKETPRDSFYIGVPDKQSSRLFKDDYFKSKIESDADVDFANIGIKDRIIIYRQVGVVPAYAINGIMDFKREYEDCDVSCHFDDKVLIRMQREEFSLMPKRVSDNDLLEFWVKGFIFGLIRNFDGKYQFQSESEGQVLDDNWVDLCKYRDEAFDEFRRHKIVVRKEFSEYLDSLSKSKGGEAMEREIADAKANYLVKYSQINMTKEEIKAKGFEKIKDLISLELQYVKRM